MSMTEEEIEALMNGIEPNEQLIKIKDKIKTLIQTKDEDYKEKILKLISINTNILEEIDEIKSYFNSQEEFLEIYHSPVVLLGLIETNETKKANEILQHINISQTYELYEDELPLYLWILVYAIKFKNNEIFTFILQQEIDLNYKIEIDKNTTLLHEFAESDQGFNLQIESLDALIKHGANPNTFDNNGFTPFDIAFNNDNFDIATALKTSTKTINIKKLVLKAMEEKNIKKIEFLLKEFININYQTDEGITLLHLAICKECIDIVNLLLNKKIDINTKNNSGETALCIAHINGNEKLKEVLIKNGANTDTVTLKQKPRPLFSHTEILMTKNIGLQPLIDSFIDLITEIRKHGLVPYNELCESAKNPFLYKLYCEMNEFYNENATNELELYLFKNFEDNRLRDILFLMIDCFKEMDIGHTKLYFNAAEVEENLLEGETNPLILFNETFFKEIDYSKEFLLNKTIKNGYMGVEEYVYTLKNRLIRNLWFRIIDDYKIETIIKEFDIIKTHLIWYIKDNYTKDIEKLLKTINENYKHLKSLIEFLNSKDIIRN